LVSKTSRALSLTFSYQRQKIAQFSCSHYLTRGISMYLIHLDEFAKLMQSREKLFY